MSQRLPDEVAACNMIHNARKQGRLLRAKTIITPLHGCDDVYIRCNVMIRITTNHINTTHGLGYKSIYFYPTTHKKLRCTNQHALEQLETQRARNLAWVRARRSSRKGG